MTYWLAVLLLAVCIGIAIPLLFAFDRWLTLRDYERRRKPK